jgi:hypothetical protein
MAEGQPNPTLQQLGALVGEWEIESPQFPGARGRAGFEFIEEGAFLLHRSYATHPAPDSIWIIGGAEARQTIRVLNDRVRIPAVPEYARRVWRPICGAR